MKTRHIRLHSALAGALACALAFGASAAHAVEIKFRSFSASATMGPQANEYSAKLQSLTSLTLGPVDEVRFAALPGVPAIPAQFGGNLVSAVAAGSAGGGFDAAYTSGSELNKAWGFIYNSGVPFGPAFDEYLGFLYGKSVDGAQTGLELIQSILDRNNRNIVAIPVVGSSEQLSGYFSQPIGDLPGTKGIGLAGFCQQKWTLRYLSPGENVLQQSCDDLVAAGVIPAKNISFIAAIPGGGSLVQAVKLGALQGFEFATPLDDVATLFNTAENPGTVGVRYVHFPGWQQQFLITWMLVNRQVWDTLTPAQKALAQSVARDHLVSSYGENMRQQGAALKHILGANQADGNEGNDLVLVEWPKHDQERMRDATNRFLNARAVDPTLNANDRADFVLIIEALRKYVRENDAYWDDRQVPTKLRFDGWVSPAGESWDAKGAPKR
jgi:TRAP-type mannitol/chloroaromatic compound transport system substrate-binding protein